MTLLSRLRRIVAVLLIVLILFTYCDISAFADTQGSDTQGPVVNKAVTVKVAPPEGGEVIKSGEPGSFVIEATISNPTTGANVEITINLPDSLPTEYLTQFKENDTITYSGVDITLDRDKRTLSLTISGEGQGAYIPITFQFPNGITPNGFNVEIKETDIAIKTEIVGNQEIEGGSVTVNSEFSWSGVSKDFKTAGILTGKTVRPDNDPDNEYYELTTDLDFEISAISNNGGSASGDRFTKELTLNDKMTLPEGLYFAYDDGKGLSVGETDSKWQILNGTKVIAEITKPEERDNFSYEITEPAITKAENGINDVLSFNYVQKYTGDLAEYKSEMSNVDVNVSVKKDAVRIKDLMAIEGKVIENRVDMEAVPIDETDKHTSYDIESLTLSYPGQFFTVKKRSAVGTEDGKMVIDYTISIENASDVPLYNLTIEDILPSNVELLEVPEGAVYDAAARKLTWTGENIDYQGTLLKTLKVRVKDSAVAGTNIINTARATVDGDNWQSSTVTDKVYTPKADVSITKSHNKGAAAKVLPGETVEYKVEVKNSGLGQASCTITDTFASAYLTNLRNFKYSIDGTNWYTLTGYTIEGNKITFCTDKILDNNPATSADPTIYYKYEATVSQDAPAEVFINNTASVAWEDGKEDSTASISVRQRLPKVTIEKDAENPVAESSSWYKVDYSLVVKNEGDEVLAEDDLHIVDTMSGGLLPVKNPGTSGTITGTYIDNSGTSESITGSYTEKTDGIYEVVWNVKPMAAGTSAKPSQAKILYPAYIQVPDYDEGADIDEVLCAVNKAELLLRGKPSGTSSINTPMNPVPVPNKIISKLNGSLTDPYSCEIKPGDVVEYTITIANTGSSSMTVEALDTLPQPFIGSGFAWVLEENLQLIDNQLGTPELDQTAGTLTWKNVVVAPGATKTVKVVLTFPEVEKFNAAFAPSSGQRYIYNKLQVIGPDPDKPWVKKVYNSQVSHNIKAVILNVEKTAIPSELVSGGEEVTFTLKGFGTEEAAANLSLADDLTKVADYMDLKTINTGAYSGITSYDIILSYESWMPDKVIHVNDASVNNVITDSADYPFTGVTGVTWNFGTVDYLTVNANPTIKMVVKEDVSGSADNGVTLYYNGKTAEDSVPVSFIPDKILEKTAMVNGKEVNNTDNQLQEGDRVTFHIYYVNPSEMESVKLDDSNPMIDYLTTKGLEAENGIQVSWDVHDSRNLLKSGYTVTPGSFNITEDDIASSDAKKISFTLNKALEPGDKLHISYTVTVGNVIAYSQGEHNKGYEDGWGYDGSSLDTNPSNLHLLHNRVTSKYGSGTTSAETGFYYAPGKNNLYFSKAVRGFSTYTRPRRNFLNCFMTKYSVLEGGDLTNFGDAKTIKYQENQNYGQSNNTDVFDVIFYVVTVANDLSSNDDLTVKTIEDVLPDNVVPVGTIVSSWNNVGTITSSVQFGLFYNDSRAEDLILSGKEFQSTSSTNVATAQYDLSDTYNRFSKYNSKYDLSNPPTYATITAEDTAKITTIPEGYTAVDVDIDIEEYVSGVYNESTKTYGAKNYNTSTPTFRIFSGVGKTGTTTSATVRNAGVTLKPGEMFAFTYAVIIDRTQPEPRSWLNTATLNVTNTDFSIRGNLPADEDQFITVTNNATKLNISEGVRKTATSYVAAPAVVGPQYKAGITKTAVGYASDSSGATLDEVKGYTYSTDMGNVKFGDIVKWKIVATNSGNTNITGATLKDLIPYPYEVITGSDGEVATDYAGTMVAGTVTNSAGATYGEAGQTVTISGVTINANTTTYNDTKTYYIYTRYTGSEYKSLSYTNRAELYVNGNFTPTIGQPIYDEDDRTTVIGIAAENLIYPTLDGSSDSYKEVWEGEVPDNSGQGNTANNSITVSSLSSTVKYRLNLKNTGSMEYTDVVLIDKLPHVGDTGVVNAVAQRGSQFDVALKSADMTVKIIGADNSERVLTSGTDYTVGFSTETGDSGFTNDAWASGTGFTDTSPTSSTKSFRLALKVPLAVGEKLTVEFDAQLPEDSPGKTAWNNFGYSYKTGGSTLYAEPAKVGVTVEEQSLTVNKVWKDGTGEGTRPANLTISLYKQVRDGEKQLIKKYTNLAWEKSGNQWTYTFTGLPAKENGETLTYSVSETVPTGYVSAVRSDGSGVTITNSLVTQISGTKIWMDGLEDHAIRPYILLYKVVNGEKTPVSYLPDQIKWTDGTVPEGAGEMVKDIDVFTISGLPAYDENNNLITYVIDESDYPGYVLVSNSNNNLVNVRYDTTEISITKVWKDNNNQDNTRPGTIMLQVYADLKPYGEEIAVTSANVDPDDQNQWKYTIKNLPKYSEKDGHEISYSVKEVSDGSTPYESLITYGEDGGIVITNTIVGYTTIKVKKLWDDSDNKAGDRPAKLDVTVTRSLVGDADSTPVEYGLTLTATDGWEAALSDLPLYDDDGRPYEYDVTEEEVPSYSLEGEIQKAESTDADGNKVVTYTFTNKREEPTPTSLVIKARKIFDAEEGVDVKITDFKFSLTPLKYDEASVQWIEDSTAGTQIKNADANGNITFDEIEYDLAGTYMYLMKEVIPTVGEEGFNVSVDYDESEVYVKVVVVQEGPALITKVTYDETGEDWSEEKPPEFINIYSEPDDIFADFYVRKDFFDSEGNRLSFGAYPFSAQLKALTPGAPMPEGSVSDEEDPDGAVTKTLPLTDEESEGASLISFGAITYGADNIGKTYEYQITEVVPPAGIRDYSVQYDPAVYKVSVTISKKTDANELEAAIIWTKDGVPVIDELAAFENIYEVPDEGQALLSVLKQLEGRDGRPISEGEFTFQLYDSEGKLLQTVTNGADGRAVFAALKFTEDVGIDGKTYTFTIKEQNTGAPTIIYSDETVYAKVLVTKDENNKLVTSVTYSKTENGTYTENEQTITNTFIRPDYLNFRIKKAVTGKGADIGALLGIGQYSFTLTQIKEDASTVPVGLPVNNGSVPAGYTGTVSAEDVIFPQIEFTEAGTYTYEIREVIPAENTGIPGITYSQEAIKVVVSVTAEGNQLKATAEYYYKADEDSEYTKLTEADPTITNRYELPPDIEVDLQAKKNLNDFHTEKEISFEAGDFTFQLCDAEGNVVPGFEDVTNDGDGNVTFKNVPVNLGDNIFRIREVDGGKPGYTYDYGEYVAVVKTRLKGDGTNSLEWVSTTYYRSYTNETENIPLTDAGGNPSIPVFENKYEQPDPSSVDLKINKVLIGKEYSDEIFTFVLTATDGTGTPDPAESGSIVVTGHVGEILFKDIKIEKVGTYYYTISEMMPEEPNPNIEYSTEKIYAKVVAKDVDNVLTMTVTYSKTDSKVSDGTADIQSITNTYVTPTAATVTVNKVITGDGAPALRANQFSFTLQETEADGTPKVGQWTAANNESGKVSFTLPQYTEAGTYYYTVRENKTINQNAGISVSTEVINVTVTVTREDNALKADVSYSLNGEDVTTKPIITNTYTKPEGIEVNLAAKKTLTGRDTALQAGEFSFTLTPQGGAPGTVQTKSNAADGTVTFDSIVLSQAGTYTYTIAETAGTDPYITYDTNAATATVTVTFNEVTNTLSSSVSYSKGGSTTTEAPEFSNVYNEPGPVTAEISALKTYDKGLSGNDFSFTITSKDGAPSPAELTVKNAADGSISFGSITFSEEGTYIYEIKENPLTAADANYDPSIKCDEGTVIATVNVVKSTTARELVATVTYKYVDKDNTETAGKNTFTNRYEAPGATSAALQVNKVLNGNGGSGENFTFELKEEGEEGVLQTKNGGAGTITFDSISYSQPGEYLYTITEKAGTNPSIDYSEEVVYAKVVVTKNSENKLKSKVYYSYDENVEEIPGNFNAVQTITNTYTAPTSAQLKIKKAMTGDSWQIGAPILPGQYSFRLKETTGTKNDLISMVSNGTQPEGSVGQTPASDDVIFPSITYTEAGTYTYEIKELPGSLTGIDYSDEIIKVTVVVEKDAENHKLYVASVSYTDEDGNTLTDPAITNKYTKPEDITVTLQASKSLVDAQTGDPISFEAGEFSFELLDEKGNKIFGYDPVVNSADGSIKFENVSVTLGENIFMIKEVIPEVKDTSITYDETEYYAVVTTELDPDDKTKLKVVSTAYYTKYTDAENNTPITEDKPVFNNKYTPPDGTKLTLEALKRYIDKADNSEKTLEAGKFKFMLYKDADRNEAIGEAVYNGTDGKVTFGEISINEAGTYIYYIGEVVLKQGDEGYDQSVTYDDTLYKVTVVVGKIAGANELEVKSVEYAKADGSPLESGQTVPTFVNEYEKPNETTLKLEAQKSYNLPFSADEFAFTLTPQSGAPASANADATTGVETVGTLADGTEISSGDYQAGIEFSEITFDEPGDYIYIIEETKGSNSSISYDGEEITAKVHVYRHATYNYLVADVTYTKGDTSSNGKLTFENEYAAPAETSQSISLSKTFVDEDGDPIRFGDNVFRFKLEAVTPGAPVPDPSEVATTFNDKAVETLSFGEIKFTEDVGEEGKTYVYKISEVIPEDMASGKNPSVEYDENIITVEITVTKGTSGEEKNKLIASSPVYYDAAHNELDDGAIFTNKYEEPEKTDVILEFDKIYKELIDGAEVNRSLDGDDFSFTLTPEDGAPEPSDGQLTAKNNADGKIVFGKIEFTEDVGSAGKTYTYTVSENNGGYPSITYDDKPITVEITVTKDEYNNLQTSVVYKKGGEEITAADALGLYFKNVYEKPEPAEVNFDLTKVLENADLSKYTFDFTLTPKGDAPASQNADAETGIETVQNTADGKISFSTITFGEDVDSKVYTYIIAEKKGINPSIDYDDSPITVTVTVTKGTEGENKNKLMTSVQYTKDDSDVTDDPKFENTYNTPTPVTPAEKLKVTKRFGIIGEDGELQPKAFGTNVFRFSIEAVTEGAPLPDNTEITTTDANNAEEELFFGDIEFTEDVGSEGKTYEYHIKEVIPADRESGKNPSVTYDEKVITAKITVTKNDHNDLVASVPEYLDASGAKLTEDVTFTNTYEEPEQFSQTFELTKLYTDKELVGDDFEFVLKDSDGNELETVTNTVDGKITFTPITFTEDVEDGEKVYEYTITEVDKNYPSITYDGEPITVKVKVTKTDDNKLSAVTTYEKAGEDVTGSPSFSNTYTEPEPTSIVLQVAKEYKNGSKLKGGEFTFILRDNEGNEISTAVNDGDGNVVFDEIKYNADIDDETYHYTISELKGSKSDIVYDNKIIDVDVRVVKSPENKLTAEAKYYVEGEETDEPKFVNTYVPPVVGAFVNITADKVYKNGTLNGNDFKFMLKAEPGNPYNQTKYAYNDALGNISFDYILFYSEGEYKFTVTEVAGDNPDIKYDGGTVEVTVKVTRTQYGTLEASVEYAKDGEPGSTFINEYVNPDTITVNIFAKKVLKGRELEGNEFNFMLTPLDGAPGEEYSVRNAADGTVAFREMTFDEEGIYRYRITELQLSKIPYVTYDAVPVDVTVTVIRNDEGRLTAKVAYSKAGASSNVFTNIYNCKEDDNNPKTGDVSGLLAHMILFSGSSVGLFTFMLSGRRRRKNEDDQPE